MPWQSLRLKLQGTGHDVEKDSRTHEGVQCVSERVEAIGSAAI